MGSLPYEREEELHAKLCDMKDCIARACYEVTWRRSPEERRHADEVERQSKLAKQRPGIGNTQLLSETFFQGHRADEDLP